MVKLYVAQWCKSIALGKCLLCLNSSYTTIYRELNNNGFTIDNYVAQSAHNYILKRISEGNSHSRGSNENAYGMIRRFFKKGAAFEFIDDKRLQKSVYIINQLPRKIHNGLSAHEVYYGIRKKMICSKHRQTILFLEFRGIAPQLTTMI